MLHTIMSLLDNSAHIDSYMPWQMVWLGVYTVSDKHPVLEIGLAI